MNMFSHFLFVSEILHPHWRRLGASFFLGGQGRRVSTKFFLCRPLQNGWNMRMMGDSWTKCWLSVCWVMANSSKPGTFFHPSPKTSHLTHLWRHTKHGENENKVHMQSPRQSRNSTPSCLASVFRGPVVSREHDLPFDNQLGFCMGYGFRLQFER